MYVFDTSAVIDGRVLEKVANESIAGEIIIPVAVLAELEYQANTSREVGFAGIKVIRQLKNQAMKKGFVVSFQGEEPKQFELEHASSGAIDAMVRRLAKEQNAVLVTCDRVQYEMARLEDVEVEFLEARHEIQEMPFLKYFDDYTQSVHLKEFCKPVAKKGVPGNVKLVELTHIELEPKEVRGLASEIIENAKQDYGSFIEIDSAGATVVQLREYRIVITKPPFSDGYEITIVRPIAKKTLSDYELGEELTKRLEERAEGVLVCGAPGMGKSTFAAALAEHYKGLSKVVKTLESPRDLHISKEVTQYALEKDSYDEITDIILLVRPDYCIFDEVRKTKDFEIFTDLRLAGIGLVGVVHATNPIDAIQRFIGRVDLGIIPQIIDTVIFIHSGKIRSVYELRFTVKVPTGMFESDLARPVIEVFDVENSIAVYEIYTFGEETVVIPIEPGQNTEENNNRKLENLKKKLGKIVRRNFHVELKGGTAVIYLHHKDMAVVIGKKGKTITGLEKQIGLKIKVEEA